MNKLTLSYTDYQVHFLPLVEVTRHLVQNGEEKWRIPSMRFFFFPLRLFVVFYSLISSFVCFQFFSNFLNFSFSSPNTWSNHDRARDTMILFIGPYVTHLLLRRNRMLNFWLRSMFLMRRKLSCLKSKIQVERRESSPNLRMVWCTSSSQEPCPQESGHTMQSSTTTPCILTPRWLSMLSPRVIKTVGSLPRSSPASLKIKVKTIIPRF